MSNNEYVSFDEVVFLGKGTCPQCKKEGNIFFHDKVNGKGEGCPSCLNSLHPDCQRCRECGKPAVKLFQLEWVEYDYDSVKNTYSTANNVIGDPCDSVYLCAVCFEKLENGELSL